MASINSARGPRIPREIPDIIKQYTTTQNTIALGLLDIALLTANAAQLKHFLLSDGNHKFYTIMVVLISLSIILQVLAGICQLSLISFNMNNNNAHRRSKPASILNHVVTAMVFLITVVNVIISAIGIDGTQLIDSKNPPLEPGVLDVFTST